MMIYDIKGGESTVKEETDLMKIFRDIKLREDLEKISQLLNQQMMLVIGKVYRAGIEEGLRIEKEQNAADTCQ